MCISNISRKSVSKEYQNTEKWVEKRGAADRFNRLQATCFGTLMCLVSLCVLRLTNIGFVQCLQLSPPLEFCTRAGFYVLRASSRKHRVCAMLFPQPLLSLYACVCHVLLCVLLALESIGFVQCFSLGLLLKVCTLIFLTFCYAYFPSQTSGLCNAFPLA